MKRVRPAPRPCERCGTDMNRWHSGRGGLRKYCPPCGVEKTIEHHRKANAKLRIKVA